MSRQQPEHRMAIVDDSALANELFAAVLTERLGVSVVSLPTVGDFCSAVVGGEHFDSALVDLSFPEERATGLEALWCVSRHSPVTSLAILTQGDLFVAELLRDCWSLFTIGTVISKSAPVDYQVEQVRQFVADGFAPVDPSVIPMLPACDSGARGVESYGRLVGHAGHVKLWTALLEAGEGASYQSIASITGLRLNTVKNYRSQLLGPLAEVGLSDPTLAEMQSFAQRLSPVVRYVCDEYTQRSPK